MIIQSKLCGFVSANARNILLILARGADLKSEKIQSCKCLQRERASEASIKRRTPNHYEFLEDCIKGYNDKGEYFVIDKEDYDKIKEYRWTINHGYWRNKRAGADLHQIIMGKQDGLVVDHIDRDKNNNRKSNLRFVSQIKNSQNRSKQYNNTSGVTGVRFHCNTNKWQARITFNNKKMSLGYYWDKEDAIKARLRAECELFGKENAPQKHLFEKYQIDEQLLDTQPNL